MVTAVLLPTACTVTPTPAAQPTQGAAPTSAPTSVPTAVPQELVIGAARDQYRLEGAGTNLGIYPLNTNIGEALFKLTPAYEVVPWLAESAEYLGENTWQFKLRQGVKFHNGDVFDAEAAKWSLEKQSRWQPLIPADADGIVVVDQ